jgi:hypothetical protein
MKRIAVIAILLFFTGVTAWAQDDFPRAEVAGGFAFQRSGSENFPGWHASVAGNFHTSVGIAGEISGLYKSVMGVNTSTYQFLLGPRFGVRMKSASVFSHILFGAMNSRVGYSGFNYSKSYFEMAYGGGVDVNAGKSLAIRVAQLDVLVARVQGIWGRDFRYMGGIVFKFGSKN